MHAAFFVIVMLHVLRFHAKIYSQVKTYQTNHSITGSDEKSTKSSFENYHHEQSENHLSLPFIHDFGLRRVSWATRNNRIRFAAKNTSYLAQFV